MTTMAEPEWDEQTRGLALGEVSYAATLCSKCGMPTEICQNPENFGRFVTAAPPRCFATDALLTQQKGFTEEKNPNVAALVWLRPYLRDEEAGRG